MTRLPGTARRRGPSIASPLGGKRWAAGGRRRLPLVPREPGRANERTSKARCTRCSAPHSRRGLFGTHRKMKRAARALRGGAAAARPIPEPAALTPKDIRAYTQEPLADRWGVPADRWVFFLASRLEDQLGPGVLGWLVAAWRVAHAWPLLDGYRQARKLAGGKAQGGVRRYRHPCPRESGHRPPFPGRGRRLAAGLGVPAPALHDSERS